MPPSLYEPQLDGVPLDDHGHVQHVCLGTHHDCADVLYGVNHYRVVSLRE